MTVSIRFGHGLEWERGPESKASRTSRRFQINALEDLEEDLDQRPLIKDRRSGGALVRESASEQTITGPLLAWSAPAGSPVLQDRAT